MTSDGLRVTSKPRPLARQETTEAKASGAATRSYADLHEHLEELKKRGLLLIVDRPIDKDAVLHPLVRGLVVDLVPVKFCEEGACALSDAAFIVLQFRHDA